MKSLQKMLGHTSAALAFDTFAVLFDDGLENVATALNQAGATAIAADVLPETSPNKWRRPPLLW